MEGSSGTVHENYQSHMASCITAYGAIQMAECPCPASRILCRTCQLGSASSRPLSSEFAPCIRPRRALPANEQCSYLKLPVYAWLVLADRPLRHYILPERVQVRTLRFVLALMCRPAPRCCPLTSASRTREEPHLGQSLVTRRGASRLDVFLGVADLVSFSVGTTYRPPARSSSCACARRRVAHMC